MYWYFGAEQTASSPFRIQAAGISDNTTQPCDHSPSQPETRHTPLRPPETHGFLSPIFVLCVAVSATLHRIKRKLIDFFLLDAAILTNTTKHDCRTTVLHAGPLLSTSLLCVGSFAPCSLYYDRHLSSNTTNPNPRRPAVFLKFNST
jgi:hypothetical protein